MIYTDWKKTPPNKHMGDRTQVPLKLARSDYARIRDEAARRGITIRALLVEWIEPKLEKLRK